MILPAPIILFTYSRANHVFRTIEALRKNTLASDSDLIVFSDAACTLDKKPAVDEVRAYLKTITGFRSVTIHHRPHNFGLANSIIEGVNDVLQQHEHAIVLEDDMLTSPFFLTYMNEALERFADNECVASVHGYLYPLKQPLPEAFFLPGADCWGWATWRRAWAYFNADGQYLFDELTRLKMVKAFDYNGAYPYSKMLEGQIKGSNDSWAVRWYASAFLAGKLTLYPGRSLVNNIGNDASGTHCSNSNIHDVELSPVPINLMDIQVAPSIAARQAFEDFFRQTGGGLLNKLKRRVSAMFMRMVR